MNQDEALIKQLCARFQRKPRKCRKINDSNIGSAERILCINNNIFYYYPKIQQFQDLDFDKLQYVVPKAGVKLNQILQLKFPPRRQNERNYFSITLPKNKILKFTKTSSEIIVDETAEGEQVWTFEFDYDIVALPTKEKKIKEARLKEIENEKLKRTEVMRSKQKEEEEKIEKIREEINSLTQAEELRSGGGENEEYKRKREQMNEREDVQRRIIQADELFFHYYYRKLLVRNNEKYVAENQLLLLQQLGKFRKRAEAAVIQFIDELSFSPIKLKHGVYYEKANLRLKVGEKNLNQQFLANCEVANNIYEHRLDYSRELRVPLKALVKYKGFKVLACAMTPLDFLGEQQFDQSILHGNSLDNWIINFALGEYLTLLLDRLKLKPYFCEVHYQKVQIHLGSNLKILETQENPFRGVKNLQPATFAENGNYKVCYLYDIDEVFPIDLDLNRSVSQQNIRLRPEYVRRFIELNSNVSNLSAGSLTYSFDDEEGEKEDIIIAKASQMLKLQQIVRFVRRLDNLDYIVNDPQHLSKIMRENGINMRYLGRIIKITQLPYIRVMAEIDAIARVIRNLYRDHQKEFCLEGFRNNSGISPYIQEAYHPQTNAGMRNIRIKQLRQEEDKYSRANAVDFLNMAFGLSQDFQPFWQIVQSKVGEVYEFEMKQAHDYPHGYLLKTVLYHCGISLKITDKLKLFYDEQPFSIDDEIAFKAKSKVYELPTMSIYKISSTVGIDQPDRILSRLQLQLLIKRALGSWQAPVLLQLSKLTSKVGPPTEKYTLESFFYYLYHPSVDNFQAAHRISQVIFPTSHPYIMELYLEYSKLKDLDPVMLKRAAEIHAIRNLGISHWKTSEILANFKESEYINHLIRAVVGVEPHRRTDLYLSIVKELAKYGKISDSLLYVNRSIKMFDKQNTLTVHEQQNYFEIMLQGIENHYLTRTIEDMLKLTEVFYNALVRYNIPYESKWYELLLFYSLKGYLQSSKKKYYLFKLILLFKEQKMPDSTPEQKSMLFNNLGVKWKESRNHINHIKEILIKLQFGFTEINYLPNFFGQFYSHVQYLKNDDFNQGLKEFKDLYAIFGFKYFEEALLGNVYSFEKDRQSQYQ